MIADPPSNTGKSHKTWASPFPAIAKGLSGALGTVEGVTGEEGVLNIESPMAFVANTVNVYCVPFTRVENVAESWGVVIDIFPGLDVTV